MKYFSCHLPKTLVYELSLNKVCLPLFCMITQYLRVGTIRPNLYIQSFSKSTLTIFIKFYFHVVSKDPKCVGHHLPKYGGFGSYQWKTKKSFLLWLMKSLIIQNQLFLSWWKEKIWARQIEKKKFKVQKLL